MTTARARRATAPEEDSGHRDGPRDGHRHAPQDGPRDRPRRRRRRIRFSRSTAKEAAYLLLDLPMGTVTSRLVRGRQALMEMLGEAA